MQKLTLNIYSLRHDILLIVFVIKGIYDQLAFLDFGKMLFRDSQGLGLRRRFTEFQQFTDIILLPLQQVS